MARLSRAKVKAALETNNGNVSAAARSLGCTRKSVYAYVNKHPDIKELLEDERQGIIDEAEERLMEQIKKGDTTAIIFTLKTRGRDRGWGESSKVELTGANGGPIQQVVAKADLGAMTPSELSEHYRDVLARSNK